MPKSRKRKNAKSYKQVIPVQTRVPMGTQLVDDPDNPGKKRSQTNYALVKTNKTRVVKHIPQKKG